MTLRFTLVFAFIAISAAAQTAAPPQEPDIAIFATVRAKELRFTEVPEVKVTFPGDPRNINVWVSDRTNLPDKVEPYVTYRDIGIKLTITTTLANIEQILNEALGPQQEELHDEKGGRTMRSASGKRTTARAATAADDNKPESRRSKHGHQRKGNKRAADTTVRADNGTR